MDKKDQKKNAAMLNSREEVKADYDIVNHCLIIRLMEDLDHHNAISIREQSDRLIKREHIKNIVFDFSGTEFMDSSGIGVIMGRYKKIMLTGGKVFVTGVNLSVDRIFRLSGLYRIILKYETIEDALQNIL